MRNAVFEKLPERLSLWRGVARCVQAVLATVALWQVPAALAWESSGHQVIGLTTEKLLAGTPTLVRVHQLLDKLSLQEAGVWADCVKGVRREASHDFSYAATGRFAECAVFETPAGIAAMESFVRRNHRNCAGPGEECHRRYHYTDVALQREAYRLGQAGTQPHDVVQALHAALQVLAGQPSPAPFVFADQREALLLLVHWVGDLHQPLHVGSVYLDAEGKPIDPDRHAHGREHDTVGGNALGGRPDNLHRRWDEASRFTEPQMLVKVEAEARRVKPTSGDRFAWPERWASDSLGQARQVFDGLQFGHRNDTGEPTRPYNWSMTLPEGYRERMDALKLHALAQASARLAQLLRATLP